MTDTSVRKTASTIASFFDGSITVNGRASFFSVERRLSNLLKVLAITFLITICCLLTAQNAKLLPTATATPPAHRRLDWTSQCTPDILSSLLSPPLRPTTPLLKKPAYIASFPGSGDKIFSKYLVEALSGLQVGEAAVSPSLYKMQETGGSGEYGGQGEVVAVRTHFPHTSGKLASWDGEIPRVIVILRNPLHAIPSYFNEVYEIRNHLPPGSSKDEQHQADTHATWIKWRDAQYPSQTMLYRRFVSFWMERHIEDDNNRIFFTYEELTDWYKGPGDAKRMQTFLEKGLKENVLEMVKGGALEGVTVEDREKIDKLTSDATKNLVREGDAPCIWKELIFPTSSTQHTRRLQSVDLPYSSSAGGEWDPIERPLTPENLAALSQMLLELMNRWSRHQRLLNILAGYHREVNKLYLQVVEKLEVQKPQLSLDVGANEKGGEQAKDSASDSTNSVPQANNPRMQKRFHIIQASPPLTGSTVATNWLIGLFEPFSDYAYMSGNWPENPIKQSGHDANIETHIVTKTDDLELVQMYKKIRPLFDEVFFVVSYIQSDLDTTVKAELCQYKNVLCIPYEELVFTNEEELRSMVGRLTATLKTRFEYFFGTPDWLTETDELNSFKRLQDMVRAKTDMAGESLEVTDLKFGIHGGGQR
ncbi:hypothetical protein HJC23_005813 [Cyclotella cryptica]|uniref:Sulfotransferase domain-containing protein n=1 Tax=Cyclotella cryptica TaxID=29204 RepID=A0ABD3QYS9_9STRA